MNFKISLDWIDSNEEVEKANVTESYLKVIGNSSLRVTL